MIDLAFGFFAMSWVPWTLSALLIAGALGIWLDFRRRLGPVLAGLEDALRVVEEVRLSAAVLDYTRSIKDDHAISRRLTALNIPFVFCKEIGRNEAWPHAPVLSRPVDLDELTETLGRLLGHGTKALHAPRRDRSYESVPRHSKELWP